MSYIQINKLKPSDLNCLMSKQVRTLKKRVKNVIKLQLQPIL